MWAAVPIPVKPSKKGQPQLHIICLKCGASVVIWEIPNWQQYGCESCAALPTPPFAGHMKYFAPMWNLSGWDLVTPIEDLIAAGRIIKCECNQCKGTLTVREAE